jgi:hypothetical protein
MLEIYKTVRDILPLQNILPYSYEIPVLQSFVWNKVEALLLEDINALEHSIYELVQSEYCSKEEEEQKGILLDKNVQHLLVILYNSSDKCKCISHIENILFHVFKMAEYVGEEERERPPLEREFSPRYVLCMKRIYTVVSYQTLLRQEGRRYISKRKNSFEGVRKTIQKISKEEANIANSLLQTFLENYNFSASQMIKAWKKSTEGKEGASVDKVAQHCLWHLEVLRAMESQCPGIGKTLEELFGIRCFGRYTEKCLIAQYNERDDTKSPYGVAFVAREDHSGCFLDFGKSLEVFVSQIGRYKLRIGEIGGKRDMARHFLSCHKKYGHNNKIAFVIFKGHGRKDIVFFGEQDFFRDGTITSKDLHARSIPTIKSFLEDSPSFIFVSCFSGKRNGIAQQFSREFQGTAIGASRLSKGTIEASIPRFKGEKIVSFDLSSTDEETCELFKIYEKGMLKKR